MRDYRPDPDLLADRVILVTGAGDGIGRAAAESCAAHGATVILLGRTTPKLEAVYDAIVAAGGPQPAIYPMNLEGAAAKDYEELAAVIESEFGRLDGLLNNAAMLGALMPFQQFDIELWYRVFQINVNATFVLTRACIPLLLKAQDPRVLFVSDQVTRKARAYWGAYGVSKFAVNGMMEILADEMSNTKLRVNGIIPGPTRTELRRRAYPGEDPNNLPKPAQLMPGYLYLLGPESGEVNGELLHAQQDFAILPA